MNTRNYHCSFPSDANRQKAFLSMLGKGCWALRVRSHYPALRARVIQCWKPTFSPNSGKGVPCTSPGPLPTFCERDTGAALSHPASWETSWQTRWRKGCTNFPLTGHMRAFNVPEAVCVRCPQEPPVCSRFQNTRQTNRPKGTPALAPVPEHILEVSPLGVMSHKPPQASSISE